MNLPREIFVNVTIEEILSERTWRVILPNGRGILVYGSKRRKYEVKVGDQVVVALTPADFSSARLVGDPPEGGLQGCD